ncbi:hypothetical protein MMC12_000848 [Toensbergia leucococca]|nr:hypothetical protein [Toensbergia leucococca]
MSTPIQQWNAVQTLEIEEYTPGHPYTCIFHRGGLPTREICHNHITTANRVRAFEILERFSSVDVMDIMSFSSSDDFEELALLLLCPRHHSEVSSQIIRWLIAVVRLSSQVERPRVEIEATDVEIETTDLTTSSRITEDQVKQRTAAAMARIAINAMEQTAAHMITAGIRTMEQPATSEALTTFDTIRRRTLIAICQISYKAIESVAGLRAGHDITDEITAQIRTAMIRTSGNARQRLATFRAQSQSALDNRLPLHRGTTSTPANTAQESQPQSSSSPRVVTPPIQLTPGQVTRPTITPTPTLTNTPAPSTETHRDDNPPSDTSAEDLNCPICYRDISSANSVVMRCKHRFCSGCIERWFVTQERIRERPTCPCCRACFCYVCWVTGVTGSNEGRHNRVYLPVPRSEIGI